MHECTSCCSCNESILLLLKRPHQAVRRVTPGTEPPAAGSLLVFSSYDFQRSTLQPVDAPACCTVELIKVAGTDSVPGPNCTAIASTACNISAHQLCTLCATYVSGDMHVPGSRHMAHPLGQ